MKTLFLIGIGSSIGGMLRYVVSQQVQKGFLTTFPYGTLSVNILGCFLIGFVFALSDRGGLSQDWRLFLATGICGGFTTFSAFSNETLALLRDGQFLYAGLYVTLSVVLGLLATFSGYSLLRLL
jgi:CrcB protein